MLSVCIHTQLSVCMHTQVAWNPQEAFNFTVANEDNNLYSYDMRKLQSATTVHKDFTSARRRAAAHV